MAKPSSCHRHEKSVKSATILAPVCLAASCACADALTQSTQSVGHHLLHMPTSPPLSTSATPISLSSIYIQSLRSLSLFSILLSLFSILYSFACAGGKNHSAMLHFNLAAQCEDVVVVVVVVEDSGAVVGRLNVFKARVQPKESRPFGRPLPSALCPVAPCSQVACGFSFNLVIVATSIGFAAQQD